MPSNTTPNYQLNQWAADDQVQRVDFNADNAKVDAAIKAVDTKASTKAEQSALDAEIKTRQSTDTAINTKINTINAALPKKGNCQVYYTTYTGDGKVSRTLTFPGKPLMVIGMSEYYIFRAIQGAPNTMCRTNGFEGAQNCATTWSGNSLTWSGGGGSDGPNASGRFFYVAAFMDASE